MPQISFSSFRLTVKSYLDTYLKMVFERLSSGALEPTDGGVCLFPSIVVFTATPTHYVFELFGARRQYRGLKAKQRETSSFTLLMEDFEYDGATDYMFAVSSAPSPAAGDACVMANIAVVSPRTLAALEERFPGVLSLFATTFGNIDSDEIECVKSIDSLTTVHPLIIRNGLITNSLNQIVRARYTNLFFAIPADLEESELSNVLRKNIVPDIPDLPGVQIVAEGHGESIAQAGQLANLYLQGMQETTLTQFLEDHSEIIRQALGADQIFFQPEFAWHEGNPDPAEISIRPDIVMRKKDGNWYIVDFKLPLLKHASITTGGHRRRRFVHTIADGISQLHNYRDYFNFDANRQAAAAKLGEQIHDPRLMLVVGTSENVDLMEVNEAMRALKPIDIMDYDTLIHPWPIQIHNSRHFTWPLDKCRILP